MLDQACLRRYRPARRGVNVRPSAWRAALIKDSPLIRWAPHSALIWAHGDAPNLLRVRLEESSIKLDTEAIDQKILETAFGATRKQRRDPVACSSLCEAQHPEVGDRLEVDSDRVVEEPATEIDARQAVAHQHREVTLCLVCADIRRRRNGPPPVPIGNADRLARASCTAIQWHYFLPPIHHPVRFGKEPVTAEIDPVAVPVYGARNAAHAVRRFDHDRVNVGLPHQLEGGRQARGPAPDDERGPCRGRPHCMYRLGHRCAL